MTIKEPPWYTKTEAELLKVRPLLYIGLIALIGISIFFLVQLIRGKSAIPAAAWVTYMFMP